LTVCQWFGLKTTGTVFSGFASKPVATVFSVLASKPVATVPLLSRKTKMVKGFLVWASKPTATFDHLDLKITATISWFGSQNQTSFSLSVAP
jgi:hypothetical protein